MNDRVLVSFSCGAASAVAAKMAVEKYGDRVEVIYCDTLKYERVLNVKKQLSEVSVKADDAGLQELWVRIRVRSREPFDKRIVVLLWGAKADNYGE